MSLVKPSWLTRAGWGVDNTGKTTLATKVAGATFLATTIAAIAGVVIGALALYGAFPKSTALWTHVGLLGGVATLGGITLACNSKIKGPAAKGSVFMFVLTALAIPVLFGALGAKNIIPPHDMLWGSSAICGGVVLTSSVVYFGVCCSNYVREVGKEGGTE